VPGEQAVLSAEAMTEVLELACSARTMPWPLITMPSPPFGPGGRAADLRWR